MLPGSCTSQNSSGLLMLGEKIVDFKHQLLLINSFSTNILSLCFESVSLKLIAQEEKL